MIKSTKLIDQLVKVNDSYSVTNCHNGYVVEVSGQDHDEQWVTVKHVMTTLDELKSAVQDLAWMPKA